MLTSHDSLFILKDYSTVPSAVSFECFQFKTEKDVICYYQKDSEKLEKLNELKKNSVLYENFIKCITGKKTLPLMYDSVFKKIFDFKTHPDRLTSLLTSILGFDVKIVDVLNNTKNISEKTPGVIFDIVVEMEYDSLANLEAQKNPYDFTGNRFSFYSAELVNYMKCHLKSKYRKEFDYNKAGKAYTIVIFEKTTSEFKKPSLNKRFLFHGKFKFDEDIEMYTIQELYIVALDVFKNNDYSVDIESIKSGEMTEDEFKKCCTYELSIWLKLFCLQSEEELLELAGKYPWIQEILVELIEFMQDPEEALTMFSSILAETDRISIEHDNEKLREMIAQKDNVIEEKDNVIAQQDKKIIEIIDYLKMKNISLPNYIVGVEG